MGTLRKGTAESVTQNCTLEDVRAVHHILLLRRKEQKLWGNVNAYSILLCSVFFYVFLNLPIVEEEKKRENLGR